MENEKVTMIPYAAFEMLQDRCLEEKKELMRQNEEIRKHDRKILIAVCGVFLAFIIAVFGTVYYILSNYEFASYSQDVQTGNANFIGNDGDINNGEAGYPNLQTEVSPTEGNGNK